MSEIICECGHPIDKHEFIYGCVNPVKGRIRCECVLSADVVEARFWARYYYNLYIKAKSDLAMVLDAGDELVRQMPDEEDDEWLQDMLDAGHALKELAITIADKKGLCLFTPWASLTLSKQMDEEDERNGTCI